MKEYKYRNPLDDGYKQFKLSKKQHNKLFEYRQIKFFEKYEYYYNDNCILMHRFHNNLFIILNIILFPFTILFHGFENIKQIWVDFKSMFHQKQSGFFSTDDIGSKHDLYKEIMKIICNIEK